MPTILLRSEESGGHVSIVETAFGPRKQGPFLHTHDFDEAFYLLEGELTFQLGDEVMTVRAGEMAFAPRGVPHTFANRSAAPAKYLIVITPAGFERYFARRNPDPPEWAQQPIPDVQRVGPQLEI
jgi:quercetin dioxygenase-like cupin family protein